MKFVNVHVVFDRCRGLVIECLRSLYLFDFVRGNHVMAARDRVRQSFASSIFNFEGTAGNVRVNHREHFAFANVYRRGHFLALIFLVRDAVQGDFTIWFESNGRPHPFQKYVGCTGSGALNRYSFGQFRARLEWAKIRAVIGNFANTLNIQHDGDRIGHFLGGFDNSRSCIEAVWGWEHNLLGRDTQIDRRQYC